MKNKAQKQKDLEALAEQFKNANAAMLVSFNKMTVGKDQELRRQLREAGVTYSVVKNTLGRRAAEAAGSEALLTLLEGPSAIAFLEARVDLPSASGRRELRPRRRHLGRVPTAR